VDSGGRARPRPGGRVGPQGNGILTSVSDYHIFLKLKLERKGALEKYLNIARTAVEKGITPRCHFEDVTRADIHGFCIPLAVELMRLREESGVDVKIRLCDTLGFGVTYPGSALPRSVPKLVRAFIDDAGVPGHLLEWHGPRFSQGAGKHRDGLALRVRGRKRHLLWVWRAHGQRPHRGPHF